MQFKFKEFIFQINILLTISLILISCESNVTPETFFESSNYEGELIYINALEGYNTASVSADGKYFLPSFNKYFNTTKYPKGATIFELATFKQFKEYTALLYPFEVSCAAFSPTEEKVFVTGRCYNGWFGNSIVDWDYQTNSNLAVSLEDGSGNSEFIQMKFSTTGDTLIGLLDDYSNNIAILDFNTRNYTLFDANTYNPTSIKVSNNFKYVLFPKQGALTNISKQPAIEIFDDFDYGDFTPDSKYAVLTKDNKIYFYNLDSNKIISIITDKSYITNYHVTFSKDGKFFATIFSNTGNPLNKFGGIQIWETAKKTKVCAIEFSEDFYKNVNYFEFVDNKNNLMFCDNSSLGLYNFKYNLKLKSN